MAPDRRRPAYRGRLSRLRQTQLGLGQRRAARRGMVGDQALRLIELSGASDDERAGQATVLGQPPVGALLAQGLGAARGRDPAADDQEVDLSVGDRSASARGAPTPEIPSAAGPTITPPGPPVS